MVTNREKLDLQHTTPNRSAQMNQLMLAWREEWASSHVARGRQWARWKNYYKEMDPR